MNEELIKTQQPRQNIVKEKSFTFALKIIDLYKYLSTEKKEFVLSKQLLRAGTSIGANLCEAELSISKKEFIAKAQIALKEASETEYWLLLLSKSNYIKQDHSILNDVKEIIRILTAIIKTSKERIGK